MTRKEREMATDAVVELQGVSFAYNSAPVLTDEYAPVDQLLTPGVRGG